MSWFSVDVEADGPIPGTYSMTEFGVVLVEPTLSHTFYGTCKPIVRLCTLSKDLYNKCNFLMRQAWFGEKRLPDLNILVQATQNEECFLCNCLTQVSHGLV